jgi:hypothetical protein
VVWENLDGQPHDFTIQNSDGTNLQQSEQISEQGATASLTFTATPEMSQYVCTVHPDTMVGDVDVSGGGEGGGQGGDDGGIPLWSTRQRKRGVGVFIKRARQMKQKKRWLPAIGSCPRKDWLPANAETKRNTRQTGQREQKYHREVTEAVEGLTDEDPSQSRVFNPSSHPKYFILVL